MGTKTKVGLLAAAAVAGALALIVLARHASDAAATSDTAVIESYTLVASRGALMLGPYSRFQWHHPGPLYFYWMAPFYTLSDFRATGLDAGALALNLLSLAVIAWVIARRATAGLAVAICGMLAVYLWRASEILASPWNPHVTVIPMMALLATAAATLAGTMSMLPVVGALASLVAQTHVALMPSALAIGALALAGTVVSVLRGAPLRSFVRSILATAVLLLVLWIPPLLQQLTNHPGNITELWTFFAVESHPGQTLAIAVSAWSDMLSGVVRPDFYVAHGWVFRESPVKWAEGLAVVQGLALTVGAVMAYRAKRGFDLALIGLLAVVSALALWSATRIEGAVYDHEVFWMSGLGVLNTAQLMTLAAVPLTRRIAVPSLGRPLALLAASALVALGAVVGVRQLNEAVTRSRDPGSESTTTKAVADDLRAYLVAQHVRRPLVRIDQDAWGIAAGVLVQLQKAGVPTAVEDDWLPMFTPDFADDRKEAVTLMVAGKAEDVRLRDVVGDTVVVSHDPIFVHRLPSAVNR